MLILILTKGDSSLIFTIRQWCYTIDKDKVQLTDNSDRKYDFKPTLLISPLQELKAILQIWLVLSLESNQSNSFDWSIHDNSINIHIALTNKNDCILI
jgi:hypothetical protein